MGIHISLLDDKRNEVPEWDFTRYSGDRQFGFTEDFEWDYLELDDESETCPKRPKNIEEARRWLEQNDYLTPRMEWLLQQLEQHPLWGIEVS